MSRLVDLRRREDAHDAAIERGKVQLRVLQSVLSHFAEGLSARASAERLGVSSRSVETYRSWLRLGLWVDAVSRSERG